MSEASLPLPPLRLLLLGYGHVTQAFLPLLASRSTWLERTFGICPVLSGIGTRSQGFYISHDEFSFDKLVDIHDPLRHFQREGMRVENAEAFIAAGKSVGASVLIELTTLNPKDGQPALTYICHALEAGMHVITVNKGPVAYAQVELQALARQHKVQFRFESTVMDGFPLFNLAQFTLPTVGVQSFRALLNTTSSLVLSRNEAGASLDEAISKAQQLGIAEADPGYDLDGWDATMKTTILANTLLDGQLTPQEVRRDGIRNLSLENIRAAASAGSPFRLVSSAKRKDGIIFAEVRPERISPHDILHTDETTTSVISLETEAMGRITLIEHEPVVQQTAYGVFSDLVTILQHQHAE